MKCITNTQALVAVVSKLLSLINGRFFQIQFIPTHTHTHTDNKDYQVEDNLLKFQNLLGQKQKC